MRAVAPHFMAIGQLFLTYASRHTWMRPFASPYGQAAVIGGVANQFVVASLPVVSNMLGNAAIPVKLWTVVLWARSSHGGCLK